MLDPMAEITLKNLCKTYSGDVAAVRGLDLTVTDGELLVLVGPSGCGKTTTLRLLAGLESPEKGQVLIGGQDMTGWLPAKRNLAMIFQEYSLYPHLTARKNIVFALKLRKLSPKVIEERLNHSVELTGIGDLLTRRPGDMSGGERQRVALAAAIAREPDCLLLDEPLSNLDATSRRKLRNEIKALHQRCEMTMIHVTHDQEEAMSLGDRIAVMHKGQIRQIGAPQELYDHPADRFVAGFLGSPAMNFIEGHFQADEGSVCFCDGHGLKIAPAQAMADTLGQPRARAITLGIRPEHLRIQEEAEKDSPVIAAQFVAIERLGGYSLLHARTEGGSELIARIGSKVVDNLESGSQVNLCFDPGNLHFFEPGGQECRLSTG